MVSFERWKIILVLTVCVMALCYSSPNVAGNNTRSWMQEHLPSWLPNKTVNLGLDLQGGAHLLMEVGVDTVIKERAEGIVSSIRPELRKENIAYSRIAAIPNGVRIQIKNPEDQGKVKKIIRKLDTQLEIVSSGTGKFIEARMNDMALKQITDQAIGQSIEIIRRRVDETGTREPTIQRQGEARIIIQLPGMDDPEHIKSLLGQTAKLSFHLVDTSMTTKSLTGRGRHLILPMSEDPAQTMSLERKEIIRGEMLTNAQPSFQDGLPVVSFRLDSVGAKRFCDVTRKNVGEPFAIVLDGEIISAPRINGAICGGAAIITGQFSVKEVNDLALLLRAGALPAPLKILEERTVGPSLGADSVEAGKIASLVGLLFILVFMVATYGLFGLFADIALVVNVALIFAVLSVLQATLTLPGIAGIVLTIGMAVDANVLIFERIKEEVRQGRSPIAAVDSGYKHVMSTIVDANLTTLIAAVILFSFGTGPIKGFAVTLGVGIMTSFFSAIWVTRLMVVTWLQKNKPAELPL
jgi:preprotein translocase subunit SecD